MSASPTRLFVYGTLIDPDCQRTVAGRTFPSRPGRLDGWRRIVPGRGYPHLVPDPTASVAGVVLDGVAPADWHALDDYEDAGNLYIRRTVNVSTGDATLVCEVYVGHRIPPDWR